MGRHLKINQPLIDHYAGGLCSLNIQGFDLNNLYEGFDTLKFTSSFYEKNMEPGSITHFTARKQNGRYWYAYKRVDGKLRKRYISKVEDLCLGALLSALDSMAEETGRRPIVPKPDPMERIRLFVQHHKKNLEGRSHQPRWANCQKLLDELETLLPVT